MTTPLVKPKPVNESIFHAIFEECAAHVEAMPKTQELISQRDALIKQIEGKVPRAVSNDLSDVAMNLATQFAWEMFRIALDLGRNPAGIFDLPDCDYGGEA